MRMIDVRVDTDFLKRVHESCKAMLDAGETASAFFPEANPPDEVLDLLVEHIINNNYVNLATEAFIKDLAGATLVPLCARELDAIREIAKTYLMTVYVTALYRGMFSAITSVHARNQLFKPSMN